MKKQALFVKITILVVLAGIAVIYRINVSSQDEKTVKTVATSNEEKKDFQNPEEEEIRKLIGILKDQNARDNSSDLVINTIKKLGSIKPKKAIPELIDYLDYEGKKIELKSNKDSDGVEVLPSIPLSGRYPAVGALFQIGEPALPALVNVIENEDIESLKSQNAIETIHLIFRDDLSKGIKYLETSKNNASNQVKKQRLSYAVEKTKMKCQKLDECRTK